MNQPDNDLLFPLGQTVMTPGAQDATTNEERMAFLSRHVSGDWGETCEDDAAANIEALKNGSRILSIYTAESREKIWIITEADRSSTCVLLPDEY